ncbi:ubiquitin-conjugating enzyme [Nitzschia inconspicua]|uniref:E2 ubiquitin-conjugating enzyme n=1 Tax=Nitzschia inconspicua TaxID=303405 RepID=A0A9K3KP78_9STRA|nr:ubiquitin-conjugating enzyme [Nitzschia inconspicua]
MSSSTPTAGSALGSLYRPYHRSNSTSSSSSSIENLPPRTLSRVTKEVRELIKNPPEGIRLVVDHETGLPSSLGEIVAEVEGPQGTPYEGKFFRLKLVLGMEFPMSPPRGFFLTKIYHPNVDMTTGAICVNTLKKDWTPDTSFSHVLSVIRCLLIFPFPESSLNDEAGKLFMESYDEYSKRAHLMADVHGRPYSSADEGDEKRRKTDPDVGEDCDSPQRLKSRLGENGSNPLASKSSNNISSSGANSNSKPGKSLGAKKPSSSRMIKKKSLKRL